MSTQFELKIPDEPFKNSYDLGKTLTVTYTGTRYLVLSILEASQRISACEMMADSLEEIDLSTFNGDGETFCIVDCHDHLLEASFITHQYSHEDFDDYEEELPTGEIYTYPYEQKILGNIYNSDMPTYDKETNSFGPLSTLQPVNTNENFWKQLDNTIAEISSDPDIGIHESANQELTEYLETLKKIKTDYAEVDYWKIPYPVRPA